MLFVAYFVFFFFLAKVQTPMKPNRANTNLNFFFLSNMDWHLMSINLYYFLFQFLKYSHLHKFDFFFFLI